MCILIIAAIWMPQLKRKPVMRVNTSWRRRASGIGSQGVRTAASEGNRTIEAAAPPHPPASAQFAEFGSTA
jgi:hypothetical protein